MSAADVIDEIKKLTPGEQVEVYSFLRGQLQAALQEKRPAEYADDASFEAAMKKVLEENAGLLRRLAQ